MDLDGNRPLRIQRVLLQVLAWNMLLSLVKIVLGISSGLLNITADGVHSIGDSLSNLIGLIANTLAKKTGDDKYPYGYEKFETVGALLIVGVIAFSALQILIEAVKKLFSSENVAVHPTMLVILAVTIVLNFLLSRWEYRKGLLLGSQILETDATEKKSDVLISLGIFAGLVLMKLGIIPSKTWCDAVITLVIVGFLVRVVIDAAKEPIAILCDAQVEPPEKIKEIVMSVEGVRFCHGVRSHGRKNSYFLNLDIGVAPEITVQYAHDSISHEVKRRLRDALSGLKYACIHIEPDTPEARVRQHSIFRERDPYDHPVV